MFIPVANNWFTIKIELINYCKMGLLGTFVEKVIVSHEMRICDIGKPPFSKDGWL